MKSTVGQGAASVDLKHYSQKKRYNNRRTLVLAIKGRREADSDKRTKTLHNSHILGSTTTLLPYCAITNSINSIVSRWYLFGKGTIRPFQVRLDVWKGKAGGFWLLHFLPSSAALTTNWCNSGPIHLPSYLLGQTY